MAAGLSLASANLHAFRERLNELARQRLRPEDLQPPLRLDAEIGLGDLDPLLLRELNRLRPIGQGNPPLQFCARRLAHGRPLQRIGSDKQHVKMWVRDGTGLREALWWGAGNKSLPVDDFDIAFTPHLNVFNGHESVQLKVLDWRPAEKLPSLL
jgi:single-stranded-DNA-specific exonuclease